MVHLCYCCFYSFNFRSLSCHINKLSKTQHNVLLTIFCVQDYMFQKYVWILVVVVHIIRYVSTCTISRLSTIQNVILSLQVYTIINYKINCQNVGTKTDGVDEIVSSFFTTLNRKFVPNNVIKNNCDAQEQFQTICMK